MMTIDDKIRDENPQYDINRETTKMSTLSSGEIDKYKYLTDEVILPFAQSQIIDQSKLKYYPLRK